MRHVVFGAFLILSCISAEARTRHKTSHPKRLPPTFDVAAVNNPDTKDIIGLKSEGSAVLRAQVLLDRAHFSVGQLNGEFSHNMFETVKAYQGAHGLQPSGSIDSNTWQTLDADSAQVLVPYTISPQDMAGPFERIPKGIMAEAKLPYMAYTSSEEELGEKFHCSPRVLEALNTGKDFRKPGEQITVPKTDRALFQETAGLVVVRKDCNCVEVFDTANKLIAHYPATMGSTHDPLPLGDWKIGKPELNPEFHYNPKLFWDAKSGDKRTTLKPGPNNPVGQVWIPISKPHYGMHGTPEPAAIGETQSHGCIRLTNWDAIELAGLVQPGMTASLRS